MSPRISDIFSTSCCCTMTSSFAFSISRARLLLELWDLSSVHLTWMPVGTCFIRTAVSTLLTFCPPAPPLRMVVISRSPSGISKSWGISSSTGITSTAAKLVSRVAALLKGDCRTRRCVPCSPDSSPYACRPDTSSTTDFTPATSPGLRSDVAADSPAFSAYRVYIRSSISAQSCASVPPAPAVMVTIAPCSLYSPASRLRSFQSFSSCARSASCPSVSLSRSSPEALSPSSCRSSSATVASSMMLWICAICCSSSFTAFSSCMSFCACSGESHSPSATLSRSKQASFDASSASLTIASRSSASALCCATFRLSVPTLSAVVRASPPDAAVRNRAPCLSATWPSANAGARAESGPPAVCAGLFLAGARWWGRIARAAQAALGDGGGGGLVAR
mmetsp:Transcript_43941/g.110271  ORF Transcript_43941/g.110271 Transcript_43941/m.110271 type:complete len:392 (-) Transcript_43941:144-1319(-)